MTTVWFRLDLWSISATKIRPCPRSTSSRDSKPIRSFAKRSRAAKGLPMARASSLGRLAVRAQAGVSWRSAHRLRGGICEFRPDQGLSQRHTLGNVGGRQDARSVGCRPGQRRIRPPTRSRGAASDIGRDLYKVRNVKPLWSRFGLVAGIGLGGADMWTNELFNRSIFGTLKHGKPDSATLKPISEVTPIVYPKPDGIVSFDKSSSVFLSNTNHEEDQPVHLRFTTRRYRFAIICRATASRRGSIVRQECMKSSMRTRRRRTDPRFVINAQNCVHCKTCDIKDPAHNIEWTPPEGGGGPNYPDM